jgi:hypothetical protein
MKDLDLTEVPCLSVPIAFLDYRIACLICNSYEGGSAYWAREVSKVAPLQPTRVEDPYGKNINAEIDFDGMGKYAWPMAGGSLSLESDDGEISGTLTRETCLKGLQVMAAKYPRCFADFMQEQDDAGTADVYIQCCLFGEAVYG